MKKKQIRCKCGNVVEVPKDQLDAPITCPNCEAVFRPSEVSADRIIPDDYYYICPNPKCDFEGTVYPQAQPFTLPVILMLIPLIILVIVGGQSTDKGIGFLTFLLFLDMIVIFAGFVILATQIVLRVSGRTYCPDCGTKLR